MSPTSYQLLHVAMDRVHPTERRWRWLPRAGSVIGFGVGMRLAQSRGETHRQPERAYPTQCKRSSRRYSDRVGRRILAGACAIAGVYLLTGPGWALLLAAGLFALPSSAQSTHWHKRLLRARDTIQSGWTWVRAHSRRAAAVSTMPIALILVAVGAVLSVSFGVALLVTGVILGGVSLALGWNQ